MALDLKKILIPGNCYVSPYAIGIPILDYGYSCASHFYCPNTTSSVVQSLPQICTAGASCVADRLATDFCSPQGPYEPQVCPPGNYCPTYLEKYECPSGSWCPTGTVSPRTCPPLSTCNAGSVVPSYYGGLIFCVIVDALLAVAYYIVKCSNSKRERNRGLPKMVRTLTQRGLDAAVSPEAAFDSSGVDADEAGDTRQREMSALPATILGSRQALSEKDQTSTVVGTEEDDKKVVLKKADSAPELTGFMNGFLGALEGKQNVFIDFRFEDLGLCLKNGKSILKGVTGEIRSKRLTAIMGPSGCGKTTFMSVLMGKVARTSGKLFINGVEGEMQNYKKIIGYVPQEDIMLRELTVRENIYHSARVRLPKSWTNAQVSTYVDDVLEVLNLAHIPDTLIGSESERGISGGQRKRVNIGMELAGVPIALFLDEPTSGLDSTAALKVAEILRRIASLSLTVVSVIHQPRYEIFQQFNDLLMLAPGGRTAYIGPTVHVVEYYKELGFYFDTHANPADILMDILSGKGVNEKARKLTPDDLVDTWVSFGKKWVDGRIAKLGDGVEGGTAPHTDEERESSHSDLEMIVKKRGSSTLRQALLCHNRYLVQQYRRVSSLVLEVGVAILAGALMGIAVSSADGYLYKGVLVAPYAALTPSTVEWLIPQLGLLVGMACGLAGAPAGVKVFAEEQTVYWREAANGHNKFSYFLGKAVASIYRFLISSLHFAALFVFLGQPSSSFDFIYLTMLLQFWSVYGLAMVISMVVRREDSALLAVVVCLFAAVFCGYGPTIKAGRNMGIEFIYAMSYNRWATEAWFSRELSVFADVYNVTASAERYGYVLNKEEVNLGYSFVIGFVLRGAAFILMVLLNRDKQK
ncbi:hypothetical protein BJ741DRAFT_601981 [Chytriomyces cf. hyalinus JEL632]|nr:hypothetical protein BJ741DRAFT_601981 [Chytriomyces cf. hyalinus JEL632]